MDIIHNVEYNVRDIGTRSVILFPTQAQVTRQLKDVPLRPGTNEIIVYGLNPAVEENSIKVDGTGAATVTDISVELRPNREVFEDVYPDSDEDKSDKDESDNDDDALINSEYSPSLVAAAQKMVELQDNLKRAKEVVANAHSRLQFLDSYGKSLEKKENVSISESLEAYKMERAKAFEDHMAGSLQERLVNHELKKVTQEHSRLLKAHKKQQVKANKDKQRIKKIKAKAAAIRASREAEIKKAKERVRRERQNLWPKNCYTVRIQLEVNTFTPMSSRRASISSEIEVVRSPSKTIDCEPSLKCDLLLTYITSSASWAPSYDLQMSTTNCTGSLCFDARLYNFTGETWENAKVTLSTSLANLTGADSTMPILQPWKIKLAAKGSGFLESDILNSREEKTEQLVLHAKKFPFPKNNPFLANSNDNLMADPNLRMKIMTQMQQNERLAMAEKSLNMAALNPLMQVPAAQAQAQARMMMQQQQQQTAIPPQQQQQQRQAQFQMQLQAQMQAQQQHQQQALQQQQAQSQQQPSAPSGAVSSGLFGRPASGSPGQPASGGLFGRSSASSGPEPPVNPSSFNPQAMGSGPGDDPWNPDDNGTLLNLEPTLEFQESLVDETGLTTTYDLPGQKTLAPKFTASKQRVARISFNNIFFSHTVVAKYQPAAHLRAKLKNNSKMTLLRGPVSLTLDGGFMGKSQLPRCSAGDFFSVSLGVDPAIRVSYPKPEVRRTTTGMFNKEDSSVYVRTVTVQNTRATAGKPVNLLVLDQIPVSEDERLRVQLLNPCNLVVEGPGVPTGAPGRETAEGRDWGTAKAYLKKDGKVSWEAKLNAGKVAQLTLEYSVAMPNGEIARQC